MEELNIYIRVSTKQQVDDGYSLDGQMTIGIAKAKALGMTPVIYKDAGLSASSESFETRPQLTRLLNEVKAGRIKFVWVFDVTRLSRNDISKAKILTIFRDFKVKLYDGHSEYDFDSSNSRLLWSIMSAVSEYESDLRKSRFAIGALTKRRLGYFLGPITPYGYDKDENKKLIINKFESDVIERIVHYYLEENLGAGLIANILNEEGVPTKSNKVLKKGIVLKANVSNRKKTIHKVNVTWNPGTITSILKNTVLKGVLTFKNDIGEMESASCPSIIKSDIWDEIQIQMKSNNISQKKEDKYFYLLKGLLRCAKCNLNMNGRIKVNRGEWLYRCSSRRDKKTSCHSRSINIFHLNDAVWFSIVENMDIIEKGLLNDDKRFERVKKEIDSHTNLISLNNDQIIKNEVEIEKGMQFVIEGIFTKDAFRVLQNRKRNEIRELGENTDSLRLKINKLNDDLNFKNKHVKFIKNIQKSVDIQSQYLMLNKEDYLKKDSKLFSQLREIVTNCIQDISVLWVESKKIHKISINFKYDLLKLEFDIDKSNFKRSVSFRDLSFVNNLSDDELDLRTLKLKTKTNLE